MRKFVLLLSIAAGTVMVSGSANAADAKAAEQTQKHVVVAGESLSTIAADTKLETWRPIWNANIQLANPDVLNVGEELVVPSAAVADRPLPAGYGEPVQAAPVSAAPVTTNSRATPVRSSPAPSGDVFARIRARESGGNYATNTGNGYYGAYQYDDRTWGGYGGYRHASEAPPEVQDQKAQQTYAARGCSPWPNTCY